MKFDFKKEFRGIISIIGASEINKDLEKKTIELGRLLAKNRFVVSCGGLTGVMEAVCKGVKQENGLTIGIIPFKDKSNANKYVDIPIPFSQARNIVVVLSGDVIVAIGGKAGTLSELCFSWIYDKPIIALENVEGWSSQLAGKKIDDRRDDIIYPAKTPEEILKILNEILLDKNKLTNNKSNSTI